MAKMVAENSHSSLEILTDLAAVLSSTDSEKHELLVWTFAKHEFGYSLKLFWKFKHDLTKCSKPLCREVT